MFSLRGNAATSHVKGVIGKILRIPGVIRKFPSVKIYITKGGFSSQDLVGLVQKLYTNIQILCEKRITVLLKM